MMGCYAMFYTRIDVEIKDCGMFSRCQKIVRLQTKNYAVESECWKERVCNKEPACVTQRKSVGEFLYRHKDSTMEQ